ncbi:epimerase family protein SDR39U1-like protein [Cucumis melo var. makuwa]|uniref:Epimerase family protein SDR39U1-like protein n=1 Tax=Cucumis melo var. makuwa TaxID=1194695 RepID=A0A5D3BCM9_CUCMM|nr:epimerase family protein SDR39U1-like protein [Cucumis melo var. makuwa]
MAFSLDVGFCCPLSDSESFDMSSILSLLGDGHLHLRSRSISFCSPNPSKGLSGSFSFILGSPCTSRNLRKVKISKKVNVFAWHALHERVNGMACIQTHSSFLLGLQWCFLCSKLSENLNHIFGRFQFALLIQKCFLETFGVCLARNGGRLLMLGKKNQLTVSITGATGFIGRRLVQRLHADKHNIRVLTRSKSKAELIFPAREFPGIMIAEEPGWKDCIQGSDGVVNLAGMPISTRWSSEIKKEIKQSRIRVTSKVVSLINDAPDAARPTVLVSATAVGYYGTSETATFDERSPSGNDYLAEVCREWEATALGVNKNVRVALIRIGVVLGKEGGALAKMIPLFMMFAGGPLGSGKQWFSWIHLDDIVNLIYEALINPSYQGVINGTAPNPVTLGELCKGLGAEMGRPSWLPVPDFALKAVLGEGASVVLEGQRVVPTRAKELGFSYKYPSVKDALKSILS